MSPKNPSSLALPSSCHATSSQSSSVCTHPFQNHPLAPGGCLHPLLHCAPSTSHNKLDDLFLSNCLHEVFIWYRSSRTQTYTQTRGSQKLIRFPNLGRKENLFHINPLDSLRKYDLFGGFVLALQFQCQPWSLSEHTQ